MTSSIELEKEFKNSSNVLINMDTRTDFDALCTSVVLSKYLKSLGKKVDIIHAQKINITFNKFFSFNEIKQETDIAHYDLSNYDLVVFVDSGTKKHVSLENKFEIPKHINSINFDHHAESQAFAKINFNRLIGSCCSLLYSYFKEINYSYPKEYIDILAVGLLTDTGFFKYDSVTPLDFKIAGEMLEQGVKLWDILTKLDSYESIYQIKFKELVYTNLVCDFNKKIGYSIIKLQDIKDRKINLDKVFIRHSDLLKYIEELDISFVLAETNDYIELSFRSKDPKFDVRKLANEFGGGGHITGAGAKLYNMNSLEEAKNKVLAAIDRQFFPNYRTDI